MDNRLYLSEFRKLDISFTDLNIVIGKICCIRPFCLMSALIPWVFPKTKKKSAVSFFQMKDRIGKCKLIHFPEKWKCILQLFVTVCIRFRFGEMLFACFISFFLQSKQAVINKSATTEGFLHQLFLHLIRIDPVNIRLIRHDPSPPEIEYTV